MAIAQITLDRKWLRRIRGRLDEAELLSAMESADLDMRTWFRRLFAVYGRDEEFEIIEDVNGDPLNISEEVIADYEANVVNEAWRPFKTVADAIAALFAMEWADFMGGDGDPEDSSQYKAVARVVKGQKKRLEAVGFVILTTGDIRYFSRFLEHRGMVTKKRSRT